MLWVIYEGSYRTDKKCFWLVHTRDTCAHTNTRDIHKASVFEHPAFQQFRRTFPCHVSKHNHEQQLQEMENVPYSSIP